MEPLPPGTRAREGKSQIHSRPSLWRQRRSFMEVLYRRCCGLDIHKDAVTACVLIIGEGGSRDVRKKEFRTFTADLHKLRLWLHACKVEHVAIAYASNCTSVER